MPKITKQENETAQPLSRLLSKVEGNLAIAESTNVWKDSKTFLTKEIDKDSYNETVNLCRFFYRTEPLVSTVINKLVEITVNDIIISKKGLSDNEHRIFNLLVKPKLLEFCETMGQELLISGLVVPEIGYDSLKKEDFAELGIKKYTKLKVPVSMWVRDPNSIKIYSSMMSDTPSYYVVVPDEIVFFIKNKGKYPSGQEDKDLFDKLKTYYPDFVKKINNGDKEFLLENGDLILRRKYVTNNPYPIPYVESALDALQHKRRMRRMEYSVIDKVISAIMHVKVGSDEFPVTDTDEDKSVYSDIRNQLMFRFQSDQNLERIFQLITNHTVDISWIFPDMEILKDQHRYDNINEEILFGLGFPRVLISGETTKSGTSDPDVAILSPLKTAESLRRKLMVVIKDVVKTVAVENKFTIPTVKFKPLNLHSFETFMVSIEKLYNMAGISRSSVAEYVGYDFAEEIEKLEEENNELKSRGLPEFGAQPFSRPAGNEETDPKGKPKSETDPKKVDKKVDSGSK